MDGSWNVKAKSQLFYDEAAYRLISGGANAQWQDPNTTYRGNATTTRSWHDIANNLYVEAHGQFDNFGSRRKAWDANGNRTQSDFSSYYQYAYPTGVTSPIPDSSGVYGSDSAFTTSTTFDPNTGLPTSTTDINGQTTQISYADPVTNVLDP
jgi:hypothetical protein